MFLDSSTTSAVTEAVTTATGRPVTSTGSLRPSSLQVNNGGGFAHLLHYQPQHPHFANHYAAYHHYSPMSIKFGQPGSEQPNGGARTETVGSGTMVKSMSSVAGFAVPPASNDSESLQQQQHTHLHLSHNHPLPILQHNHPVFESAYPGIHNSCKPATSSSSRLSKIKKRLSTHFECFSLSPTEPSVSDLTPRHIEMTKYTQLPDRDHVAANGGIPKTITVDNLAYHFDAEEPEDEEIVEVSIPVVTPPHEETSGPIGTISGQIQPPKPPPRSTSIYHLQRLQQQAYAQLEHSSLNTAGPGPGSGSTGTSYPNVVMRDKSKKLASTVAPAPILPQQRPMSDIYEVRNALNSHVITGAGSGNGTTSGNGSTAVNQRPMSMYVDGATAAAVAGRPVRHAISRFSAYEISSSHGFGRMDSYMKLDQLGEGSYATVYKGYSNLLNRVVALKEIRLQAEEGAPFTAIREASLLRGLKHANIVTLHDIVHTRQTLILVFEYMDTDFSQYLERHPGGLNPKNIRLFMFQLLRGLAYCHERRILHRDLKPQNLLINEQGELKLADFGLARAKSIPSNTYTNEVASLWYRPPDIMLGSRNYSTSLDMWSVGCIFVEMVAGTPAFPGQKDTTDQLDKIFRVFGTPAGSYLDTFASVESEKFRNTAYSALRLGQAYPKLGSIPQGEALAYAFLNLEPRKRISAKEALRHAFFADLPQKLYQLPDHVPITAVSGCTLVSEANNFPLSVMKIAAKMKKSKPPPPLPVVHH